MAHNENTYRTCLTSTPEKPPKQQENGVCMLEN